MRSEIAPSTLRIPVLDYCFQRDVLHPKACCNYLGPKGTVAVLAERPETEKGYPAADCVLGFLDVDFLGTGDVDSFAVAVPPAAAAAPQSHQIYHVTSTAIVVAAVARKMAAVARTTTAG